MWMLLELLLLLVVMVLEGGDGTVMVLAIAAMIAGFVAVTLVMGRQAYLLLSSKGHADPCGLGPKHEAWCLSSVPCDQAPA